MDVEKVKQAIEIWLEGGKSPVDPRFEQAVLFIAEHGPYTLREAERIMLLLLNPEKRSKVVEMFLGEDAQ